MRPIFPTRLSAAAIAALTAVYVVPAIAAGAPPGAKAITCTNLTSGTSWQIQIDYDRGTVDSNPARIGDGTISWHDVSDGGNYTLDRKSGDLTVVVASATGGYFLYHHCRMEN